MHKLMNCLIVLTETTAIQAIPDTQYLVFRLNGKI